jgi:CheY-like chemotaxis protein
VCVLIVDDEPDTRELMRYVLGARGAEVFAAASVSAARDLLGQRHFDVLIADIGMPDEDGYSLIRSIRALPSDRRALPAIAVTASVGVGERDHAIEAGFDAHLGRPLDPDQLIAAVAAATGRRRATRTARSDRTNTGPRDAR